MTTAVLSLITAGTLTPKMDAASIYRHTKDSVVAIEVTSHDGMAFGTGFFFGDGQTVATCQHVVDGATKIVVKGSHGCTWIPKSMSYNRAGDTVLLHLGVDTKRTALSSAKPAQIGEPVFVIGNPLGMLTGSLTTGIVSANRNLDGLPLLQTTAPISEGSSGSPVLDSRGRVLGIVSFTFSEGQNLNMAIGSEVLRWVKADRRLVAMRSYYASNASVSGAAEHIAHSAGSTVSSADAAFRNTAKARGVLIDQVARYDGRVIDAFVRWEEAALACQRGVGGMTESDVQKNSDAFRQTVSSGDSLAPLAARAGAADYFSSLQACAESLGHIADDKAREDSEVVRGGKADAVKRDQTQYSRLVQALCEFGAASEDASWIDAESLYATFPTAAKGECIMLHQNAFVDADLPHSTAIRDALPGSVFRAGDEVKGARISGEQGWAPVDTWEDLWQFTADHGPHLCQKGWEVQVVRGGKTVVVPMCLAGRH